MEPIQYLLVGIPFSGKTTMGRALASQLGFVHVNLDQIKKKKGYGLTADDDVPDKAWKEIFSDANAQTVKALKEGKSVAHETAWSTKKWRETFRKMVADQGFDTKVIYIDIPSSIAIDRQRQNRQNLERYDTPDEEFEGYVEEFEKPTVEEQVLLYDLSIPIDEWIKQNFMQNSS